MVAPISTCYACASFIHLDAYCTKPADEPQLIIDTGLNPRHRQSGSSVRGHTSISKIGCSSIRAALYMPAVVAKRTNPRLIAFAERLAARGLCQLEIIVAVMRKLLYFAYGVLKSGQPFDLNFVAAP